MAFLHPQDFQLIILKLKIAIHNLPLAHIRKLAGYRIVRGEYHLPFPRARRKYAEVEFVDVISTF